MIWLQKHKGTIVETISVLFVLLFVYAAISKLLDFEIFKVQLGQSPLLAPFQGTIAWMVPLLELIISIMLLIPILRVKALYASYALMTCFTLYIITVLKFSNRIPCSCGGILEKLGWEEHIVFNMVFIILSIIGLLLNNKPQKINA